MATPITLPEGITPVNSSTLTIEAQMLQEMINSGKFDATATKSLLDTLNKIIKTLKETPASIGGLFNKGLGDFKSEFGKALEKLLKDVDGAGKTYHQLETLADNSQENLQVTAEMLEFAKKDHDLMEKIQEGLKSSSAENSAYLKTIADITKRETQQRAKETEKAFLGGMAHKLVDSFAPLKLLTTIVGRARGKDVESTSEFWQRKTGIGKEIRDRAEAQRSKATFARSAGLLGQEWGIEGLEQSTLEQMQAEKENRTGMMAEKFRLSNQLLMGGPNYETAASAMMKKSRPQEVGGLPMVIGDQQKALVLYNKAIQEKTKIKPSAEDLARYPGMFTEGFLYLGEKEENIIKAIKGQDLDIEGGGGGGGLLGSLGGAAAATLLGPLIASIAPLILPALGVALGIAGLTAIIVAGIKQTEARQGETKTAARNIFASEESTQRYQTAAGLSDKERKEAEERMRAGKAMPETAHYGEALASGDYSTVDPSKQIAATGSGSEFETKTTKKAIAGSQELKTNIAKKFGLKTFQEVYKKKGVFWKKEDDRYFVSEDGVVWDTWGILTNTEKAKILMNALKMDDPARSEGELKKAQIFDARLPSKFHTGGIVPGINQDVSATLRSGEVVLSPSESSVYKDRIGALGSAISNLEKLSMQKVEELLIKLNEVTARSNERIVGAIENNTSTIGSKLESKVTNESIPLSKEKISSF